MTPISLTIPAAQLAASPGADGFTAIFGARRGQVGESPREQRERERLEALRRDALSALRELAKWSRTRRFWHPADITQLDGPLQRRLRRRPVRVAGATMNRFGAQLGLHDEITGERLACLNLDRGRLYVTTDPARTRAERYRVPANSGGPDGA